MCASSYAPLLHADAPLTRVEAARRLLASCLSADRSHCAEAIDVLGQKWLQQQGLASLVWQTCREALPEKMRSDLRAVYYAAAADAELHRRELAMVLKTLNAAGLPPVVFKGAALAFGVYTDPAFRTMGDLDVWVMDDMERARQVLEAIGYRSFHKPDRPPALMALYQGEIGLQHRDSEYGLVELHWGIFPGEWLRRAARVSDLQAIHARTATTRLADEPALVLSPEDAIIQSAVHAAVNHQMSLFALRTLIDVAMTARNSTVDWLAIVQRARAWRVATAVWLVLSLAVDLIGLEEAAEAVRHLQPSTLRRRLIRRFVNAETLIALHELSSNNRRYAFLLLLVDRAQDALRLIGRALWPEREWLLARYGRVTFKVRLRHFVNAARGRI
jgi:hypothetical protein